jgi:hypothetical protein
MDDDVIMDPGGGEELIFIDDSIDRDPGQPEGQEEPGEPVVAQSDEVANLRAELANLNQRFHDTQGNFHRADQGRQFYEAMVQANRQQWEDRQRAEQAAAAMAPPQFSEEDVESLHTNPQAIVDLAIKVAEWSRQRTLAEVGPHIARLNTATSTLEPIAVREVYRAEGDARAMAHRSFGIDEAEFNRLAPAVDQMLIAASGGNPAAYQRSRLDPRVITTAMAAAKAQYGGGVPVQPSAVAPSLGGGGRQGATGRIPSRLNPVASEMERRLGLGSGEIAAAPVRNRAERRL